VAEPFRPFVRFLPDDPARWDQTLAVAGGWLAERPAMPWAAGIRALPHPGRHGSELFLDLLRRVAHPDHRQVSA